MDEALREVGYYMIFRLLHSQPARTKADMMPLEYRTKGQDADPCAGAQKI